MGDGEERKSQFEILGTEYLMKALRTVEGWRVEGAGEVGVGGGTL